MISTPPIGDFLESVERRLSAALTAEPSGGILAEAAQHLCINGRGKRIRPRLVWLLGAALGTPRTALEELATAAELIHGASLLHDDVVDEGALRRGVPTANVRWGNTVAVLAGDWILTAAMKQLRGLPVAVTWDALDVVAAMTRATVLEAEARGRLDLSEAAWRAIAEGKTGALFAWCGSAAARVIGNEEAAARLARFGRRLGIAFQLADDLRDLCGGEPKDRFADIRNRNPSLPLIRAMAISPLVRELLLADVPIEEIGRAVIASGVVDGAITDLEREVKTAVESLGAGFDLPDLAAFARSFSAELGKGPA